MQDDGGLKKILTFAWGYRLFQWMVGSMRARQWVGAHFWKLQPGQKVLDLGCGPANIVPYLPDGVRYAGFDISDEYITHARRQFAGDPDKTFFVGVAADFVADLPEGMRDADLVMINGLLHHLDDAEAVTALRLARAALAPHGRLVCLEPCFLLRQAPIARWLLRRDRGRNVRSEPEWKALVAKVFGRFETFVLTGLIRIPYTHIVIEAHRED